MSSEKEKVYDLDMEQFHHAVILFNPEHKDTPLGIAFADESNAIKCFVPMSLPTANAFGEQFCERYNEALRKIRGDT